MARERSDRLKDHKMCAPRHPDQYIHFEVIDDELSKLQQNDSLDQASDAGESKGPKIAHSRSSHRSLF